jgi:c-di-GMP-binding flagellar brake protein YcgR
MSDKEKQEKRTATLEFSSNYAAWRLSNTTNLLGKDLLRFVTAIVELDLTDVKSDVKKKRNAAKVFAAVIQSLGDTIVRYRGLHVYVYI